MDIKQFSRRLIICAASVIPIAGHAVTISGFALSGAATGNPGGNPATATAAAAGTYTTGVVTGPIGNLANASFTISNQPTPSLSLFATGNNGDGSSLFFAASGLATASYAYTFTVAGPSLGVAVPVIFRGNTSGTILASGSAPRFYNEAGTRLVADAPNIGATFHDLGTVGTLPNILSCGGTGLNPNCLNVGWGSKSSASVPSDNTYSASYLYGATLNSGDTGSITIDAIARGGLTGALTGSGFTTGTSTAFIDPFIFIDPTFLAANPGYFIQVEAGVGNTAPVPLPAALWLISPALLGLGFKHRRTA